MRIHAPRLIIIYMYIKVIANLNVLCRYTNITKQIPPSLKNSLHILCQIGDVPLAEKLLKRLSPTNKSSESNAGGFNIAGLGLKVVSH